ncbi:MAG TPA: hypothetical protein VFE92_18090 [Dermatophilaceae bacterium]|nr:hypothetical protein [Dermatophilaceae bacterium]
MIAIRMRSTEDYFFSEVEGEVNASWRPRAVRLPGRLVVDARGTAIQVGKFVAQATNAWSGGPGVVVVFELGTDGKIVSQWVHANK